MRRPLTIDEEIFINKFSQKLISLNEIESWFLEYDLKNKKEILRNLVDLVIQSHPEYDDIVDATKVLKKTTSTPAVKLLRRNKPFEKYGYEICDLPEYDLLVGFKILLLTLSISDNRRKANESFGQCTHWWHHDLSDEQYLQSIREERQRRQGTVL